MADGNIMSVEPSRVPPSKLDQAAVAEAEADFIDYARQTYERTLATLSQAGEEISEMADMGQQIAAFAQDLIRRRAKLDMALDYTGPAGSLKLPISAESIADCIVDAVYLGEGEQVLREHTRLALKAKADALEAQMSRRGM